MSQIDFGCIFDGFTMNLRFGIGEKSRGRVEPFFSPVGDRDVNPLLLKKNTKKVKKVKVPKMKIIKN